MPFPMYHEKPDADYFTSTGAMKAEADVFFQYVSDHDRYKAALRTIANQEWPEDTDVWLWAACVLWGTQCYWCMGFDHPEAWRVECQCKEDEPWD